MHFSLTYVRSLWSQSAFGVALICSSACIIDTQPLPGEDETQTQADTPTGGKSGPGSAGDPAAGAPIFRFLDRQIYYTKVDGAIFVVGTSGAAAGSGNVIMTAGTAESETSSAADGSFAAAISAQQGKQIVLSYLVNEAVLTEFLLTTDVATAGAMGGLRALQDVIASDPINGTNEPDGRGIDLVAESEGTVTLRGAKGSLAPGLSLVIVNLGGVARLGTQPPPAGVAIVVSADTVGSFNASLEGQSLDELLLFVVEAGTQAGSHATTMIVP